MIRLLKILDDAPAVIEAEIDEDFVEDAFNNLLERGWPLGGAHRMTDAIESGLAGVYRVKVWAFENNAWKQTVSEDGFIVNTQNSSLVEIFIYEQIKQFYQTLKRGMI